MGFLDKVKDIFSVPDDDYDDMPEEVNFSRKGESENGRRDLYSSNSTSAPKAQSSYEPERRNKVVNIHATTQLKVVLVKPERFDDAPAIADHLNSKRTVVLNLESANKEVSRRLIDFLSGVAYAQEGKIKKVAVNTYIITPYNVDLLGDLIDELENNGLYF